MFAQIKKQLVGLVLGLIIEHLRELLTKILKTDGDRAWDYYNRSAQNRQAYAETKRSEYVAAASNSKDDDEVERYKMLAVEWEKVAKSAIDELASIKIERAEQEQLRQQDIESGIKELSASKTLSDTRQLDQEITLLIEDQRKKSN